MQIVTFKGHEPTFGTGRGVPFVRFTQEPSIYQRGVGQMGWATARYNARSGDLEVRASTAKEAARLIPPIAKTVLQGVAIVTAGKLAAEVITALVNRPAAKSCKR